MLLWCTPASVQITKRPSVNLPFVADATDEALDGLRRLHPTSDRGAVSQLTRAVHEETVFGQIPFSDTKFDRLFDNTLLNPQQHLD